LTKELKKVLVIKLGALGDFVLALAAMKRIRLAHPKAKITLLTTPPFEGLAKSSGYFNTIDTDGRSESFSGWWQMIRRLRQAKYDRVYDLQTSRGSSRIFQALRPFPPQWSGIALGAQLKQRTKGREKMHTLERQADQLRVAGIWPDAPITPGEAPAPDLSWILGKRSDKRPVAGAPPPKPYALFVPGGSAHRLEKRWPVERFTELANILRGKGLDVVVIGGPQESALARAIQKAGSGVRDLTGRTDFAQIAALGARAALAVGNDTGPLHLIAASGAPTIALFSSVSDPMLCGPRGHVTVIQADNLADLPTQQVANAAMSLLPRR
jgi:ADP-heptose:LPS heptosyltransferase